MRERQLAFRDFERSFQQPTSVTASPPDFFDKPLQLTYPPHHHPAQSFFKSPQNAPPPPAVTMLSTRNGPGVGGQELSPKARVTYDEGKFQVEFDVQDFRPEELSIKTEGDVLVVLAKHETKTENGGSFVSKQFEQRFTLPSGVKPENISSSLAKDGTLTVSAPREIPKTDLVGFRKRSSNNELMNSSKGDVYSHDGPADDQGLPHPKVRYDEDKFQISLDCQQYKPDELDVKVEGNSIIITAKQEVKETGGTRTRVFEQKFTLPSGVKAEKVTSTFGKDGVLSITAPRGNAAQQQAPITNLEQRMDRVMAPSSWDRPSSSPATTLPRDDFIRRVDSPASGSSSFGRMDDNLKHTSLFDTPSKFFSGASPPSTMALGGTSGGGDGISRIQYDDDHYKILVNVCDFRPEDIIVKTVGGAVNLEAKREEKTSDGHSYSSRNISQSFTLPRGVNPESVTSAMSKDGVLTISAPLPPALRGPQNTERLVPVKHR
jgi:HSP20 family molecular chaperone IbpA